MKKTIILINGMPRVGKDTIADFLVYNYNYTKISFAEPLKFMVSSMFNITLDELDLFKNNTEKYEVEIKGCNLKTNFRNILQLFGTQSAKPIFGKSVWADLLYKQVRESEYDLFVVPDFRFLVEYPEIIDEFNIVTLLVKDHKALPLEGHASDVELYKNKFKFDYTIINDGTLDDLQDKVQEFIKGM